MIDLTLRCFPFIGPADVADRAAVLFGRPADELFTLVEAELLVLAGKEQDGL